ncbi:MAG TPA: ATP-binding protein [Kofleriaceae bacterium]|jgi:AAA+ superfamily predicted ATPase|nr:ATP-binding protein [Kofleriaceae bacterium]
MMMVLAPVRVRDPVSAVDRWVCELERVRLRAVVTVGLSGAGAVDCHRDELARVEAELAEMRAGGGRAETLARRLGLDDDELDLVWCAVAAAVDPRLQPQLQLLGGSDSRRGISLASHALLFGLDGARAGALTRALLGPHPLLRHHLLTVATDGLSPASRVLAAAPRLCSWLAGDDEPDPALLGTGAVVDVPIARELDPAQRAAEDQIASVLAAGLPSLLAIEGPAAVGRRTSVAAAALGQLGRPVIALDLRRLPPRAAELDAALIGLVRECVLRDAIAAVVEPDAIAASPEEAAATLHSIARRLDALPGAAVVISARSGLDLPVDRPVVRIAYPTPDTATRRALWQAAIAALPGGAAIDLELLAIRYRLGPGGIQRAVASARLLAGDRPITTAGLVAGVRSYVAERLGDLAQRIEVRQTWDDLVLAPDLVDQACALVARVRHAHRVLEDWGFAAKLPRGTGVAALFSGPPGTGKSMLAGLVARELDLELYQVDLSRVVSKWVGETEKQLARIFDAAEAGHALLLFDEADSLFARRTEVKSAVDRYANLEVNYLLQRIEGFGGVTVLTTNMDTSIDPALRRRLACQIAFWPPETAERAELWTRMLSARGPVARNIDVRRLAEIHPEMTGANIRNAVLTAAFLAAAEATQITQALLERAARDEYAAMGRVLGKK